MSLRSIPAFPFASPWIAAALAFTAPSPARAQDIDTLIAQALTRNPAIKAAEYQVKALHNSPNHAWWLDPPGLGVEFFQAPVRGFPNPLKNQMEIDYSVQQSFPFPGKIAARIRAEHGHAEIGEAELESLKRKVVRAVKGGYHRLYLLDRRADLNRRNREAMERLIAIARRQYEVGLGGQAEILRAQSEATRLRMDSITLAQDRLAEAGSLNALLDHDPGAPVAVADSLAPLVGEWPPEKLAEALADIHPELRAMQANIRMREAEGAMARKEYFPQLTLGGAYKDMRTAPVHGGAIEDYWSFAVGVDMPLALWSLPKARAGVAQSEMNLAQARAGFADARNSVVARARAAALSEAGARERLRLSREALLPQARQAWESALAAYQGGKTAFMAVLDAYRADLAAQEDAETALMGLLEGQADLEESAGMDLRTLADRMSAGAAK